jgi:phospholipid/cholesterol/gamma-HCH transport system substrate-binding protein
MSDSLPYFRYASRRVGALMLIAFAIFVVAVLQAGLLRDLFRSTLSLRVILPESGLAGLNKGAAVEILGTNAGVVREIVIDPKENFHAVVEIEEAMEPFVRRDSQVFIRKQFGIAGAAFLEITRGHGEPLDWDYAVLTAAADQAPTESMGAILEDLRAKVLPIVDDVQRTIGAAGDLITELQAPGGQLQTILTDLGKVTGRLAAGEGTVGRLLADDALARDLEATLVSVRRQVGELDSVIAALKSTSGEVERATPEITKLLRETSGASVALPTLLTQTQQTMAELQQLLVQLQGVWLLGGRGDGDATERTRLSPLKARP